MLDALMEATAEDPRARESVDELGEVLDGRSFGAREQRRALEILGSLERFVSAGVARQVLRFYALGFRTIPWRRAHPYLARESEEIVWSYAPGGAQLRVEVVSHGAHISRNGYPFQTTQYILLEQLVEASTREGAEDGIEAVLAAWFAATGADAIEKHRPGWMARAGWETQHPHIAAWIGRGDGHCLRVRVHLAGGISAIRAWYFDDTTIEQTVLVDREMEAGEDALLEALDDGIDAWTRANPNHRSLA
jgi:hypothetical protein